MKSGLRFSIPEEDHWVIAAIAATLATRLVFGADDQQAKLAILRLMFQLQRCPSVTEGLNVSVSAGNYQIACNSEQLELVCMDEGHTAFRLQYFPEHHHCISGLEPLQGDRRTKALEWHLDELTGTFEDNDVLSVEDYSTGDSGRSVPLGLQDAPNWAGRAALIAMQIHSGTTAIQDHISDKRRVAEECEALQNLAQDILESLDKEQSAVADPAQGSV